MGITISSGRDIKDCGEYTTSTSSKWPCMDVPLLEQTFTTCSAHRLIHSSMDACSNTAREVEGWNSTEADQSSQCTTNFASTFLGHIAFIKRLEYVANLGSSEITPGTFDGLNFNNTGVAISFVFFVYIFCSLVSCTYVFFLCE